MVVINEQIINGERPRQ